MPGRITLLGEVKIEMPGIDPGDRTTREALRQYGGAALLAYLITNRGQWLSRKTVITAIYSDPDRKLNDPDQTLTSGLSQLRNVIGKGNFPRGRDGHIKFNLDDLNVDLLDFSESYRVSQFEKAVSLYRGPFLEGYPGDWVLDQREAHRGQYADALTSLAQKEIIADNPLQALEYLKIARLNAQDREDIWVFLARAASLVNGIAGVNAILDEMKVSFNERGLRPSEETSREFLRITEQTHVELKQRRAYSLQRKTIGRDVDIENLIKAVRGNRQVTLVGYGGVGKTHLAREAWYRNSHEFGEGNWFVDLSERDSKHVIEHVALHIGVGLRHATNPDEISDKTWIDALASYIGSRSVLLILDNCEVVRGATHTLVESLYDSCDQIHIVCTSRIPFDTIEHPAHWETLFEVVPLDIPGDSSICPFTEIRDNPSVKLFVSEANRKNRAFDLTPANAPEVGKICRLLEGIPFNILLTASQIRKYSIRELIQLIEDHIPVPDITERIDRCTMRSYDLLTNREKVLYRRLSVFNSGWTREAAQAICGFAPITSSDVLTELGDLIDQYLVQAEPSPSPKVADLSEAFYSDPAERPYLSEDIMRFRFLEPIRLHAASLWTDSKDSDEYYELNRRHAEYYQGLAVCNHSDITGPRAIKALKIIENDHDNIRTAFRWFGSADVGRIEGAFKIAGGMWRFWDLRGHHVEAITRIRSILGADEIVDSNLRAVALNGLGNLFFSQGKYDLAKPILEDARTLFEKSFDHLGLSESIFDLGQIAHRSGSQDPANDLFIQTLEHAKIGNHKRGEALAQNGFGCVHYRLGNFDRAKECFIESLRLFKDLGDERGVAFQHSHLGNLYYRQGHYESALTELEDGLRISYQLNDQPGVGIIENTIANVFIRLNRLDEAIQALTRSERVRARLGDDEGKGYVGISFGMAAYWHGHYDEAADYFAKSLKIFETIGYDRGIAYAQSNLGNILIVQKNYDKAETEHLESLKIRENHEDMWGQARSFSNLGNLIVQAYQNSKTLIRLGNMDDPRAVALTYFLKAHDSMKGMQDVEGERILCARIARFHFWQGDVDRALSLFMKLRNCFGPLELPLPRPELQLLEELPIGDYAIVGSNSVTGSVPIQSVFELVDIELSGLLWGSQPPETASSANR